MTEKNTITIELNVNELFSSTDKKEVLYKAILEKISNSFFLRDLRDELIKDLLKDELLIKFKSKILEDFTNWTPEKIREEVDAQWYSTRDIITDAIKANADVIKKPIFQYLITEDYSKKIGKMVESNLTDLIVNQLNLPIDDE